MNNLKRERIPYLDYIRGFVIMLVALQHAVQCYAHYWGGRFWFLPASDRSSFFDMFFMYTDCFIMQALFLVAGVFVIPSLERRGWVGFVKEKLVRLGIPFAFGVIFIVPLLTYPKYHLTEDPYMSYWEFWSDIFFTQRLTSGGFWFLAFLFAFSLVGATMHIRYPQSTDIVARFAAMAVRRPLTGFLIVGSIGAALIGISDLIWGAPWWIGFWSLFYVRANMFFSYIFYFLLGVGIYASGLYKDSRVLERLSAHWLFWVGLTLALALAYTSYSVAFFEKGAFSDEIRYFFRRGGEWADAWPVIIANAPGVLVRTTLHGFLCASHIITMIAVFYRLQQKPQPFWAALAVSSYGIFIFHEPLVVGIQFALLGNNLLPIMKCIIAFSVGFAASWGVTVCLRRQPGFNRIL